MTEAEWATCDNPKAMLGYLLDHGKASQRKLRLFSCACCRRVWELLTDERARNTVEVAERFADGLATEDEREEAQRASARLRRLCGIAPSWAAAVNARMGAIIVVDAAGQTAACPPGQEYDPALWEMGWRSQCALLRDIFGDPFQAPTRMDPAWLTPAVLALARAVYEHRSFDRLPELAAALEAAGCAASELLGHLHGPGPHARGCWALDLLLGKD